MQDRIEPESGEIVGDPPKRSVRKHVEAPPESGPAEARYVRKAVRVENAGARRLKLAAGLELDGAEDRTVAVRT
jgi:hypothetical protein